MTTEAKKVAREWLNKFLETKFHPVSGDLESLVTLLDSYAAERVAEARLAIRDRIQPFCFYWKETHRRGGCKERNGKYCVFCELSDEIDDALAAQAGKEK